MRSDVEMQYPAPSMLDHKETIQELKTQRGHGKEIHGDDHFAMIGEEGEPASGGIAAAPRMSQIPGHGAGGRGRFRLKTATCCRRARISSARSARQRKKTRMAAGNADMMPNTIQPL